MNYLLDTCVLSEFTRRQPEEKVVRWLGHVEEEQIFLSVITIGEIQHGISRLPESARKNDLMLWMQNGLIQRFGERIIALETETLVSWGALVARVEQKGQPMPVMDSLIAATAIVHHLTLVTRNQSDFAPCGIEMINPWCD